MATTEHRLYPLPEDTKTVREEIENLQLQVLPMLDNDIHALFLAIAGLAPAVHGHAIGEVTGLTEALAGKMPAGTTFSLADLTDTDGVDEAPDGYVMVKSGAVWVAQSALAAIGAHDHTLAQVSGLEDALAARLLTTGFSAQLAADIHAATAKATPVDADEFGFWDSVSASLRRLSLANLKAVLKTYFDTLYPAKVAVTVDNTLVRNNGVAGQQQASGVTVDDSNRLAVGLGVVGAPGFSFLGDLNTGLWSPGGDVIAMSLGGVERFRWDSSEFIVGATNTAGIATGSAANPGTYLGDGVIASQRNDGASLFLSRVSSTGPIAEFYVSAGYVGGINVTGSVTTFATSSDYRLKTDVEDLEGSGDFIDALHPVRYAWINTAEVTAGFLAHEFAEVTPGSVHGAKDAVDPSGKPVYQGMDASTPEVMANIVAELQSLRRRVAQLETAP